MNYHMLVRNMFNDMYAFLKGKQNGGIEVLQDAYQDEPLFLALIGGLDEALKVQYFDVMKECNAFHKKYCDRLLNDSDWDAIVDEIKAFSEKWNQNPWCKKLILALLGLLEQEDAERKKAAGEEVMPSATENGKPTTDESPKKLRAA